MTFLYYLPTRFLHKKNRETIKNAKKTSPYNSKGVPRKIL